MNQIKISVVIPTYHRNELLKKCLDCLKPGVQILPADQYEVIVTDDGSKTTAEGMIRADYPWVQWVAAPGKGPAANRNNGSRYARGEWLAFTDDDCLPEPDWLNAFVASTKGSALALEGSIHPLGDMNQDLDSCPINLDGGCFWSANIAVHRTLFEKVEGFDPNYPYAYHEDADIQGRILSHTKIIFVREAIVFHPTHSKTVKEVVAFIPKRSIATAYHMNKHRGCYGVSEDVLSLTFFQFKYCILRILYFLRERKPKSTCVGILELLVGVPMIWINLRRFRKVS
ncbi:glycosyltransferase family 2 protein [Chamaesiphon sp.]|uniref:glycosyltransferase family 2 protein n=1 Tax=Chamaesiphon sp. TaxID=2814140 RepID=UPI0035937281